MALTARSLFLYGFQVTELNRSIDFRAVALETPRQATLRLGFYSLTSLAQEVVRAMQAADPSRTYTVPIDRTGGGLENRASIVTNGDHLELLFATGPRAASTAATLLGFTATDKTGATSYQGSSSAGTALVTDYQGFNYVSPTRFKNISGSVNVSASGIKESIVHQIQSFWQVEFRYEPESKIDAWSSFLQWAIQQRLLEFTPEITAPSVVLEGTLESTPQNGQGLGFMLNEMLPSFPGLYQTGTLKFRVNEGG
jgi:hypothetical protein